MTTFISAVSDNVRVRQELESHLRAKAEQSAGKRTVWALTGGTSVEYWGESVLEFLTYLPEAAIVLTDTFLASDALSQGRRDTNEDEVLQRAGLAKAIHEGRIKRSRLIFPDFDQGTHQAIADDLNRRVIAWRGEASFDVVIASSGGGAYNACGDEDPGHVFGLPHGQPELFDSEGPYIVADDMLKAPKKRITLNGRGIKSMFLFCLGDKKANAAANIRANVPLAECPACLVHHVEEGYAILG